MKSATCLFSLKSVAKFAKVCYTVAMTSWKTLVDKKICVALSGGADSVALLHYLFTEQKAKGYFLSAVHCEHGIRGEESLEDMRFVQELCARLSIPLYLFSEDCPARAKREKQSLETAARAFRQECFFALIQEGKADFIATAHHQNDEAETVLFRIARGSSLTGMVAMKPQDGVFLRPFLNRSKQEILRYIQENHLAYREDYTNQQTDATRNKLRLEILPKLEEAVAGATANIARFASLAAADDELLYRLSGELLTETPTGYEVAFSVEKPLFTRACLTAMKGLGVTKDYTALHLSALYDLQGSERGARLNLPSGVLAERTERGIALFLNSEEEFLPQAAAIPFTEEGFDGGRYEVKLSNAPVEEEKTGWKVLRVDGDKLPKTAYFRFRREGDEMTVFGGGTKSLKKLFNEKKIPPKERGYLPLIAEESGRVYAVCGVEISDSVKVDENTKNLLYIVTKEKQNGKAR